MDDINYKLVDILTLINKVDDLVFLDTETCGLYGKIRLLQAYHPDWKCPLLVEWPDHFQLAAWLVNPKFKHIWHNAHYDLSTIQRNSTPTFMSANYEDTFLLSRLAYPRGEKFSLDACFEEALGFDPYIGTGLDKKEMQKMNWDVPVLHPTMLSYAAIDVLYLPELYEAVKHEEKSISYRIDMLTLKYCMDFQTNGIPTDQEWIADRIAANKELIEKVNLPINANSWQQVRAHLCIDQSDKEALEKLGALKGPKAKLASNVLKVRTLLKQISFMNKWRTTRIFGLFKPSARSGRLTSNDQNLQQLPRLLKNAFKASPGKVFVRADFSQLEIYVTCAMSRDPEMMRVLRAGGDIHDHTAVAMFGDSFTKEERRIAKTMNFALLYYGSATVLGRILLVEASIFMRHNWLTVLRRKWLRLYAGVAKWQQQGISDWHKKHTWKTPLGREYIGSRVTDQLNIQSQGGGAEVAKLALHYMYDKIKPIGTFVNFIHDEYVVECDDDPAVYKEVSKIMANSMAEAWSECSKSFNVKDLPMPIEVNVGKVLGDLGAGIDVIYSHIKEGKS